MTATVPKVSDPDVPSALGVDSNDPLPLLQSNLKVAWPSVPKATVKAPGSGTGVLPSASSIDWIAVNCQLVPASDRGSDADEQPASATSAKAVATARVPAVPNVVTDLTVGGQPASCTPSPDTKAMSPTFAQTDAELAADLAEDAGRLLLAVREEVGFDYPWELGDAGDSRANTLLLRRLRAERPGDAVLSEEAHDDLVRLRSDRVWIIDPVDGTREFSLPRRDDWAVHVALWQRVGGPDGQITDAAVALPARGEVYRTDTVIGGGAAHSGPIRITASSNRPPAVLYRMAEQLDFEMVRIGSAGAKAMAVVRGDVDAYIHAGGQWEWDNAAPAGVVQAAGMHASRLDGSPMLYNRPDPYLPDLLMCRQDLAEVLLGAIGMAS